MGVGWFPLAVLVFLILWAMFASRHVTVDRRDRWQVLTSLDGHRVTLLAGFRFPMSRTGTLLASEGAEHASPRLRGVVIDDGRRRQWFPLGEVRQVTDPETGTVLGGPW